MQPRGGGAELSGRPISSPAPHCYVYLLSPEDPSKASRVTYVGFTTDPFRRLRQHNGEIKGGAKRTRKHRPWKICAVIGAVPSKFDGLSLEFAWQHPYNARKTRDHLKAMLGPVKPRVRGGARSVKRKLIEACGILSACEPFCGYNMKLHVADPKHRSLLDNCKMLWGRVGCPVNIISDELNTLRRDVMSSNKQRKDAKRKQKYKKGTAQMVETSREEEKSSGEEKSSSSDSEGVIDLCETMDDIALVVAPSSPLCGQSESFFSTQVVDLRCDYIYGDDDSTALRDAGSGCGSDSDSDSDSAAVVDLCSP